MICSESIRSFSSSGVSRTNQIEPTQQTWRHFDVLRYSFASIVVSSGRIRSRQNRNSRRKCANDSSFRDGDGLLLHRLQQNLLFASHFIEFVDAAQASVAQHQRAGLQTRIARDLHPTNPSFPLCPSPS